MRCAHLRLTRTPNHDKSNELFNWKGFYWRWLLLPCWLAGYDGKLWSADHHQHVYNPMAGWNHINANYAVIKEERVKKQKHLGDYGLQSLPLPLRLQRTLRIWHPPCPLLTGVTLSYWGGVTGVGGRDPANTLHRQCQSNGRLSLH